MCEGGREDLKRGLAAGRVLGGVGAQFAMVAAAGHPSGGDDRDRHATAAFGTESRRIELAPAAEALGDRFAAAGAVNGHRHAACGY